MRRFRIIEIPELLDAQEESGDELRSGEGAPAGECAGTVTESGEHGNRKKTNAKDKKFAGIRKQDEFKNKLYIFY